MLHLALVYCGLVFVAVTGTLQAAAAYNDFYGLLFFRRKLPAYLFALATVGFSLYVFFVWNYHYATGVIEGSQQAGFFAVSSGAAVIFTLVAASLRPKPALKNNRSGVTGLGAFRQCTLFTLIRQKIAGRTDD